MEPSSSETKQPHLPAEDRTFLVGEPKTVEELVTNHRSKFVSGGLEAEEDSELLKQAGLHSGSPRAAPWQPEQAEALNAATVAAAAGGAGYPGPADGSSGGGGGSGSGRVPAVAAAAGAAAGPPRKRPDDYGGDFVYGVAAGSLDFASEEMDAE